MELTDNLILDDYYKLRITSKRLNSGRYQVKFFATIRTNKQLYGYVLVEAEETLKSVINRIRTRLKLLDSETEYKQIHLFNVGQECPQANMMIFD